MNASTILKGITPPFITAITRRATGRPPLPPIDPPLVSDALNSIRAWLIEIGWLESAITKTSIDTHGKPIPWFSYTVIAFLEPRINKDMSVFEYGTGNSTIWWGERVKNIVTCEHDLEWHQKIKPRLSANVTSLHIELEYGGKYSQVIHKYNDAFDIVIIDGRDRVNCALNCLPSLRDNGVIIWDNSDRPNYAPGLDFLRASGFKSLDICGVGPIAASPICPSIFYRDSNCLEI